MSSDESKEFMERLECYPKLYGRFQVLLEIVENADDGALTADEVEERVVQEMRHPGHQALQAWAIHKTKQVEHKCETRLELQRRGKKLYWQTRRGQIEVMEQLFSRQNESSKILRPFSHTAKVSRSRLLSWFRASRHRLCG